MKKISLHRREDSNHLFLIFNGMKIDLIYIHQQAYISQYDEYFVMFNGEIYFIDKNNKFTTNDTNADDCIERRIIVKILWNNNYYEFLPNLLDSFLDFISE